MKLTEEHAILSLPLRVPFGIAKRGLHTLTGINEVAFNYLAQTIQVSYDPIKVNSDKIRSLLKRLASSNSLEKPN